MKRRRMNFNRLKGPKWPSDFGLYKQVQVQKKTLLLKIAVVVIVMILLLLTICYTAVHVSKTKKLDRNANASAPVAEKLTAHQVSVEKQVVEHISPRPFLNDLRGASPTGFSPPFGPSTTPKTYTQPTNHNFEQHPHNIQDIIQYLTDNSHRQKELLREEQYIAHANREREQFRLYGTLQTPKPRQQLGFHPQHPNQDPFFAFKPQDPGDVNLLAPSSFRFAPAVLSPHHPRGRQKVPQDAANNAGSIAATEGLKKPLSLTLTIFPTSQEAEFENDGVRFPGQEVAPRYRYPFLGAQRLRHLPRPKKMVVHLNVYRGPGGQMLVSAEGEENGQFVRRVASP